jgi:hypothetical protein
MKREEKIALDRVVTNLMKAAAATKELGTAFADLAQLLKQAYQRRCRTCEHLSGETIPLCGHHMSPFYLQWREVDNLCDYYEHFSKGG